MPDAGSLNASKLSSRYTVTILWLFFSNSGVGFCDFEFYTLMIVDKFKNFLVEYFDAKFRTYVTAIETVMPGETLETARCKIVFESGAAKFSRLPPVGQRLQLNLSFDVPEADWKAQLDKFFGPTPESQA